MVKDWLLGLGLATRAFLASNPPQVLGGYCFASISDATTNGHGGGDGEGEGDGGDGDCGGECGGGDGGGNGGEGGAGGIRCNRAL